LVERLLRNKIAGTPSQATQANKMTAFNKDQFQPVPHTADDDALLFSKPEFKAAWDALEDKYAALSKALKMSNDADWHTTYPSEPNR
jgi:hypothetical protein